MNSFIHSLRLHTYTPCVAQKKTSAYGARKITPKLHVYIYTYQTKQHCPNCSPFEFIRLPVNQISAHSSFGFHPEIKKPFHHPRYQPQCNTRQGLGFHQHMHSDRHTSQITKTLYLGPRHGMASAQIASFFSNPSTMPVVRGFPREEHVREWTVPKEKKASRDSRLMAIRDYN